MGKARDILRQRVWLAGFGLNQGLGLVFTGKEKGSRGEGEKGRNDSFVSAGEPMPARPSGRAVRSIDAPRTQAQYDGPRACVRGASIDRPPRSGGIGTG